MDKNIIEASELPSDEKVYLRKDWLGGYRVVHPDTAWKWTKRDTFWVIACLVGAGLLYLGINEIISSYQVIADNPCNFCSDCAATIKSLPSIPLV